MKQCPFCAEQIQDDAVKCRFCGEPLDSDIARWRVFCKQIEAMSPEQRQATLARLTPRQRAFVRQFANNTVSDLTIAPPTGPKANTNASGQMLPVWITLLVLFAAVAVLREPNRARRSDTTPSPAPAERPRIDPQFSATGAEFENRLIRNYGGGLNTFRMDSGTVYVTWRSSKCDLVDGEMVDLGLSIHRTIRTFSIDLKGRRWCEGQFFDFRIDADTIHDYTSLSINDSAFLERIKWGSQ